MSTSKTLENIILDRVDEVYDGMSGSFIFSPEYIKKLCTAVYIDDVEQVESLYQELVYFSQHKEKEITISYEDGQEVTLDAYVVKKVLANQSPESIDAAGENIDIMHQMLFLMFDDMINVEEE